MKAGALGVQPRAGFRVFFHVLWRFLPHLLPVWDKILLRVVTRMGSTFLAVLSIMVTQRYVDDGLIAGDKQAFLFWVSLGLGLSICSAVFGLSSSFAASYVYMRIDIRFKTLVHDHLQKLSLAFHQSRPIGEHMFRITADTKGALDMTCNIVPEFIERVQSIAMAMGLVALVSPLVGLCVTVYITIYAVYLHFSAGYIRTLNLKMYGVEQGFTAVLQENLSAFVTSKMMARERYEVRRFFVAAAKVLRMGFRYGFFTVLWKSVLGILKNWYTLIAHMFLCGALVIAGDMTIGQYFAMGLVLAWLSGPMERILWTFQRMRVAAVPAERMLDTLDVKPDIVSRPGAPRLERPEGEIVFDNVTFHYGGGGAPAVRNLSFRVPPGKKVAIVGPSGAGKTTVFNLIMRYYDPVEGRILIDGQDLREIDLRSYREQTAIVLQDTFLFSATIRDNILYGNPKASEDEIEDAIKRTGLEDFLAEIPEGLDTVLKEGGNLSGGQKQRVAMARAVIRKPRFLFLDEATSALDPVTEREILAQLREIEAGLTRVVVAHNIASIQDADEILVLDKGELVQQGNHESLLSQDGLYRKMWTRDLDGDGQGADA